MVLRDILGLINTNCVSKVTVIGWTQWNDTRAWETFKYVRPKFPRFDPVPLLRLCSFWLCPPMFIQLHHTEIVV